jgi:ABC-type ATPase with predicted acetyltransferase domain
MKTVWRCGSCGQSVTLHVRPSCPPVCSKHIKGGREMKEVKNEASDIAG